MYKRHIAEREQLDTLLASANIGLVRACVARKYKTIQFILSEGVRRHRPGKSATLTMPINTKSSLV